MSQRGTGTPRVVCRLEIVNRLGLHARAAALLVQTVAPLNADITVTKDDQTVNGKSILGLMMLAAGQGTQLELVAVGPDAEDAIDALAALVADRFYENA